LKEFTKTLLVKDNKPYLIVVGALLLIAILVVVLKNPFLTNDTEFAIKDTDEVTKIVLDDKNCILTMENKETQSGTSKIYDLNRVYAQINKSKDTVVFKYIVIDPILKNITYFLSKDKK